MLIEKSLVWAFRSLTSYSTAFIASALLALPVVPLTSFAQSTNQESEQGSGHPSNSAAAQVSKLIAGLNQNISASTLQADLQSNRVYDRFVEAIDEAARNANQAEIKEATPRLNLGSLDLENQALEALIQDTFDHEIQVTALTYVELRFRLKDGVHMHAEEIVAEICTSEHATLRCSETLKAKLLERIGAQLSQLKALSTAPQAGGITLNAEQISASLNAEIQKLNESLDEIVIPNKSGIISWFDAPAVEVAQERVAAYQAQYRALKATLLGSLLGTPTAARLGLQERTLQGDQLSLETDRAGGKTYRFTLHGQFTKSAAARASSEAIETAKERVMWVARERAALLASNSRGRVVVRKHAADYWIPYSPGELRKRHISTLARHLLVRPQATAHAALAHPELAPLMAEALDFAVTQM
ncbi:MAG: hypothetical protein ACK5QT_09290 [Oligoflexia bacterium]